MKFNSGDEISEEYLEKYYEQMSKLKRDVQRRDKEARFPERSRDQQLMEKVDTRMRNVERIKEIIRISNKYL